MNPIIFALVVVVSLGLVGHLSADDIEAIRSAARRGESQRAIASRMGCSTSTVWRVLQR